MFIASQATHSLFILSEISTLLAAVAGVLAVTVTAVIWSKPRRVRFSHHLLSLVSIHIEKDREKDKDNVVPQNADHAVTHEEYE